MEVYPVDRYKNPNYHAKTHSYAYRIICALKISRIFAKLCLAVVFITKLNILNHKYIFRFYAIFKFHFMLYPLAFFK